MTLLKRVGGGAIALCLALVGLVMVAPLASAHANSIAGAAHCETDGTYTVDWTITNNFSASERVEKISNSGGTVAGLPLSLAKQNDVGHVASSGVPGSATSAALTVKGTWSDHVIRTVTGTVTLSGTCGDDDSVEKITICHATPADTAANGWVRLTVSANAITPRGHSEHAADIIPSFSYRKNGAALSYPGKNWDVKGKKVYDNNCTLPEPPKPPCVTAITDHAVSAQYVAGNPFRAYVAYTGGQLCKDVTRTVSLNSYATDGPTWGTSGTQVFVDHASITLSQGNTSGYLQVKAPSCYYQTDLYFGSTLFDGTHGDLPHYPGSVTPQPLIAARNGGHACAPPVVKPTGTFSVTCSAQGATVTVGTLSPGNQSHVVWTLKVNGDSVLVSSGQMVQVPAKAHLALSYRIGSAEPVTKQEQDAPAACPPTPTPTPTATTPTPTPTATTPTPTPTATTPTPTPTATTPTPTPTATTPTPTPTTSTPTTSTPTTSTTPTTSGTPSATDTPTDETSVLPTKIGKTPTTPTTPDTPSGSVLPHTGGSALGATTVIGVGLLLGGLLLTLWGRKRKEVIARRH